LFSRWATLDLIYTFIIWSPVGLYSCMPFLEYYKRYRQTVEERHWRYSLFSLPRCNSQKLFAIFRMPYTKPEERYVSINLMKKRRR
jgi:hypothetical protein